MICKSKLSIFRSAGAVQAGQYSAISSANFIGADLTERHKDIPEKQWS